MSRLFRKNFLDQYEQQQSLEYHLPERRFPFYLPAVLLLTAILLVIICWLMFARVEVHVKAKGMILPIGGVIENIAIGEGRIIKVFNYPEGIIEAGDPLFTLSNPVSAQKYQAKVNIYQAQSKHIISRSKKYRNHYDKQKELLNKQKDQISKQVTHLASLLDKFQTAINKYENVISASVRLQEVDLKKIKSTYQRYLQKLKELEKKGFTSEISVISVLTQYESLSQNLATIQQQVPELSLTVTKEWQTLLNLENELTKEQINFHKNLADFSKLDLELDEQLAMLEVRHQEIKQELISLEHQNWIAANIFTEYDGQLLERKKRVGQILQRGERASLISLSQQREKHLLIISQQVMKGKLLFIIDDKPHTFTVSDSHSLTPLQQLQQALAAHENIYNVVIKGSAVSFELLGSRIALKQYDLVNQHDIPVFASLQHIGENRANSDLVNIAIVRYEDAKLVSQGNQALIKPAYEKHLIGAQLRGQVKKVSPYALTQIQSYALIGNADLANKIIGNKNGVIVLLELNKNTKGKYDWGNKTPTRPISAGVPTETLITIEKVPPILVIIPYISKLFISDS